MVEPKQCGMWVCKKCGIVNTVVGILLLLVGLGLWKGAPSWFNAWTFIGLFFLMWGITAAAGKQH